MKVIGRGVAIERAYYPVSDSGVCDIIEAGQEFDIYEGHETGTWFTKVSKKAKPKPEPTGEDIA